jgi:hypothetical protein
MTETTPEQKPDSSLMLLMISRCLTEGNCPSLAGHCEDASREILTLRAKVLHLEKITSRILEEHWKNEMYDKLEEQDYLRSLPKVSTIVPVKSTISWVEQLAYLKGTSV